MTAYLFPQTPAGHAGVRKVLADLAADARPVRDALERARMARRDAVFLYGEERVRACEAAGYASPTAQRHSLRMTDAEERVARAASGE